jgi:hypothetical protein
MESIIWTCASCHHPDCKPADFDFHLFESPFGHKLKRGCKYTKLLCDWSDDEKYGYHNRAYVWRFFKDDGNIITAIETIKWIDEK